MEAPPAACCLSDCSHLLLLVLHSCTPDEPGQPIAVHAQHAAMLGPLVEAYAHLVQVTTSFRC